MGQGMSEVLPGLYVSSALVARQAKVLDEFGITHVLSILNKPISPFPHREYLLISAKDHISQDLLQYVPQCNDFIHNARLNQGKVLIHCVEGKSRSPTIACFYIMTVTGISWSDVMDSVRGVRTLVCPNFAFQKQLKYFYDKLMLQERERLFQKFGSFALMEHDIAFVNKNLQAYNEEQRRRIAIATPGNRPKVTIRIGTKPASTDTNQEQVQKLNETSVEVEDSLPDCNLASMSPDSRRRLDDMFS